MKIKILISCAFIAFAVTAGAQGVFKSSPEAEAKAAELVSKMTLEEKIDYIGGYNGFYIRAIEHLGIPEIRMADGPQGVRNNTKSTLFPSGITTASSWDRGLMYNMGVGLGQDSRARGVHILLGPGVNMYKMPLCGRNFEYFGEDPYLAGEMAAAYIRGVQSQGVMACVKHFVANNIEWGRHVLCADIDERTLHELYLPAFEKAVEGAGVASVMTSYNLVSGIRSSENKELNIDLLRNKWGFEGILMSDWTSTYSPIAVMYGGLDLEMPRAHVMNKENLLPLVKNGVVDERIIDEKVQHILQSLITFGFFDRPQLDTNISEMNPFSDSVSLEIARGSMVLLKNQDNLLPVKKGKFVVCGPHADKIVTGGGSGFVDPHKTCSVAEGMKSMGKKVKSNILLSANSTDLCDFYADSLLKWEGAKAEYFNGKKLAGKPLFETIVPAVDFNFGKGSPAEVVPVDNFSARYTFWCKPEKDIKYFMSLGADDGCRLIIDDKEVLEDWRNHGFRCKTHVASLEGGKLHKVEIEYYDNASDARVEFKYSGLLDKTEDIALVKSADAVVVCLGFDSTNERENHDRTFELPTGQVEYLDEVLKYNDNVIVVVNAGGSVDMAPWIDRVKAVIMAWYPGQMGGQAIAEIITGKISPSGKLPISFERKIEDNPSYNSYFENTDRIRKINPYQRVAYNDGLFTGYRGYDRNDVEPMFEFGFGLSYSSFEYSDISVVEKDGKYELSFDVTNAGGYDAAEVAQVYIHDKESSIVRPEKELKGYEKVFLKKGETKRITVELDEEAFRYYDVLKHDFVVEPGEFDVMVGASSRDIRLTCTINVN